MELKFKSLADSEVGEVVKAQRRYDVALVDDWAMVVENEESERGVFFFDEAGGRRSETIMGFQAPVLATGKFLALYFLPENVGVSRHLEFNVDDIGGPKVWVNGENLFFVTVESNRNGFEFGHDNILVRLDGQCGSYAPMLNAQGPFGRVESFEWDLADSPNISLVPLSWGLQQEAQTTSGEH